MAPHFVCCQDVTLQRLHNKLYALCIPTWWESRMPSPRRHAKISDQQAAPTSYQEPANNHKYAPGGSPGFPRRGT